MTVPVSSRRAGPLACDGVGTDFDFAFKVFTTADVTVILTDSDGVESTLVLDSDYTVTLNGDQESNPGGTITTIGGSSPYAAGNTITMIGALTYKQSTAITNLGGFLPSVIMAALDYLAILCQQLKELTDRTLKIPAVEAGTSALTTLPSDRANKILGFDASKKPIAYDQTAGAVSGSENVNFLQAGTGAVSRSVQSKLSESVSVKDFGAVGDGVTNDRLAIKAAIDYIKTLGGGHVLFPVGGYLISGTQQTINVPEVQNDLSIADTAYDAQLYFTELGNVTLRFDGAKLVSDKTDGGITLCFDGCTNLRLENPVMEGSTVMSGSTATAAGTSGIVLLSLTAESKNITISNPSIDGHFTSVAVAGDPSASTRVKGLAISGAARFSNGVYGLALQNNGDSVTADNIYSYRQNRPLFIYGASDGDINIVAAEINGGMQSLVKAYSRNTTNFKIRQVSRDRANTQPRLSFQSQHNPVAQPTPASVAGIDLDFYEINCATSGNAIEFDYYQDSTLTANCSTQIFDQFTLRGKTGASIATSVTLGTGTPCRISLDKFQARSGPYNLLAGTGFVALNGDYYEQGLWTPTDDSGAALSLTTTAAACTYTRIGRIVTCTFAITYPVTASGAGAKLAGLPFTAASTTTSVAGGSITYTDSAVEFAPLVGSNAATINFFKRDGTSVVNSDLSGKAVRGVLVYIA